MEDPFLNYFALGLLFFVVIVLVYGIIAIHDIPARIAHARHHLKWTPILGPEVKLEKGRSV